MSCFNPVIPLHGIKLRITPSSGQWIGLQSHWLTEIASAVPFEIVVDPRCCVTSPARYRGVTAPGGIGAPQPSAAWRAGMLFTEVPAAAQARPIGQAELAHGDIDRLDLHANVWVPPSYRARLAQLCRSSEVRSAMKTSSRRYAPSVARARESPRVTLSGDRLTDSRGLSRGPIKFLAWPSLRLKPGSRPPICGSALARPGRTRRRWR